MTQPSLVGGSEVVTASSGRTNSICGSNNQFKKEARMLQQAQEKYEESHLYKIRHSAAHIMAQAVLEMIPEAKYTIGPPIENGFYYDFDLPRNLTPEDLQQIEKRMRQIIQGKYEFKKTVVSADEARE